MTPPDLLSLENQNMSLYENSNQINRGTYVWSKVSKKSYWYDSDHENNKKACCLFYTEDEGKMQNFNRSWIPRRDRGTVDTTST